MPRHAFRVFARVPYIRRHTTHGVYSRPLFPASYVYFIFYAYAVKPDYFAILFPSPPC